MERIDTSTHHTPFFVGMSLVVMGLVLVGFAPTFYLKVVFNHPPLSAEGMPPHGLSILEYVHGAVATAWLLAFLAQAVLAYRGRVDLHRRFGSTAFVLAAILATLITVLMVKTAHDRNATGIVAADFVSLTNRLFWGNVVMLVPYVLFIAMGFGYRHRPELHRRLMLLAMLCLLSPTIGRIARFGFLHLPPPAILLPLYIPMLAALPVYEGRTRGRAHALAVIGPLAIFVAAVLGAFVLPNVPQARSIVALL